MGIEPATRHGQNFLIDLNLQQMIVDAAELTKDDVVLEVGTGTGGLTAILAQRSAAVVTVEIDGHLFELASELLFDCPNVTMLHFDALHNKNQFDPRVMEAVGRRLAEAPGRRFKLAANLPYNIATPVLSNLLLAEHVPDAMVATIQKELAERIVAQPWTKDYGALSAWMQCQATTEIVRIMPPSVFWPLPKVDSAIVRITVDRGPPRRDPRPAVLPPVRQDDLHPPPQVPAGQRRAALSRAISRRRRSTRFSPKCNSPTTPAPNSSACQHYCGSRNSCERKCRSGVCNWATDTPADSAG